MRWTDGVGIAGLAMFVAGVVFSFSGTIEKLNWQHWLGGFALWFTGAAMMVGWLLLRWYGQQRDEGKLPPR